MFENQQKFFDFANLDQFSAEDSFDRGDNSAARSRYKRFVGNAVRYLPPKQREVLRLYFFEGLRMEQIAQRLGVSKSTVSRRLSAARRTLRDLAQLCERSGFLPS